MAIKKPNGNTNLLINTKPLPIMSENKMSMTPAPWKVRYLNINTLDEPDFFIEAPKTNPQAGYNIEIMGSEDGPNYVYGQKQADANAIVSAINNTYGKGINPEAVSDLLTDLKALVRHFDNLDPSTVAYTLINNAKITIEKSKII